MKSKKVLIGLIVAAFIGTAGVATAQPKANYQNELIEIGPDNIGGRVRSIIIDNADPTHNTLYAGGVAGGLYRKVGNYGWELIPCVINGKQVTLPISCMVQLPDNSLLIATGEGWYDNHGVNNDIMSPKGRGIYRFLPQYYAFSVLPGTNPIGNTDFSYVNRLAYLERDGMIYLYAATNEGLFRWEFPTSSLNSLTVEPQKIISDKIQDVVIISADNIAYASAPGKLYKIGSVTGNYPAVDVTSSNRSFADASRIELAANTAHPIDEATGQREHITYLYALVSDSAGLLDGVYLTHDQQKWTRLTTSTIVPFSSKHPGYINSAIAIDPQDYKTVYIGGASFYYGRGYVENSYYQWTMAAYNEEVLNGGNYMSQAYSYTGFVHSGIHQIIRDWQIIDGDTVWNVFIATDGGIFKMKPDNTFNSLNKGFNTTQYNSIAVSPDGSLIGGAVNNACPFIQARNAHNGSVPTNAWYDDNPNSILNHIGNVIWTGSGGGVDASMFQQLLPYSRRTIFVSSEPGRFSYQGAMSTAPSASYARAYADYADYTNTQTWTIAEAFLSDIIPNSNPIPKIKLWETDNNTIWNDSITFTLDTSGLTNYLHHVSADSVVSRAITANTTIVPGDQIMVGSVPNASYPFIHTFNEGFVVKDKLRHTVHNKVVSRAIVNGRTRNGNGAVYMTLSPNNFRRVWDANENDFKKLMKWSKVFESRAGQSVGEIAFSRDGKSILINVIIDSTGESFIFRIYNFVYADANDDLEFNKQVDFQSTSRITYFDTIYDANGQLFRRPITSIAVDPREGQDNIILTFGGYQIMAPNMVYINNVSNPGSRQYKNISVSDNENSLATTDPVYSALIECTTGALYAGTERGVYTAPSAQNNSWTEFGDFNGVPVTSIIQQTRALPRVSYMASDGVNAEKYLFAKTKFPYAIYYGTYGRGIFMDMTYVTDTVAEVSDSADWLGITTVDKGDNKVNIFPNPAIDHATLELSVVDAGLAVMKIYDINGKMVHSESLGHISEGVHRYSLDCSKFKNGMYLVNLYVGNKAATSKLIVR